MNYYFAKTLDCSFDEAIAKVTALLKEEGFGILTEINVKDTLKEKIGAEIPEYKILGACNPKFAHQAITSEAKVGLLLPCNVIVHKLPDGRVEVAAINAKVSMETTGNKALNDLSCTVTEVMDKVIKAL